MKEKAGDRQSSHAAYLQALCAVNAQDLASHRKRWATTGTVPLRLGAAGEGIDRLGGRESVDGDRRQGLSAPSSEQPEQPHPRARPGCEHGVRPTAHHHRACMPVCSPAWPAPNREPRRRGPVRPAPAGEAHRWHALQTAANGLLFVSGPDEPLSVGPLDDTRAADSGLATAPSERPAFRRASTVTRRLRSASAHARSLSIADGKAARSCRRNCCSKTLTASPRWP